MTKLSHILSLIFLSLSPLLASDWSDYYTIEPIPDPQHRDMQIGGVAALRDGRIAVCLHRGEVMIYQPKNKAWSVFAEGLHEPLGILEDKDGSLVVMQRPELTRLTDTTGDGKADTFQTLYDGFGMTGNYHEFAFGPVQDKEGNFYISLNLASNGAPMRSEIRGKFSPIGQSREVMTDQKNWTKNKTLAGRMYARVPYRGWIIKVSPKGKSTPFALGLRSPNGLGFDSKGRLFATDNQGDWRGTSPLYHIQQNHFYGHPASLLWKAGWTSDPLKTPAEKLDKMRTHPVARFPQGELANSPTQPIQTISPSKFGLPKGELLIGEMNLHTLVRYLPDEVNGSLQGTLIPFLNKSKIGRGNHRLSFDTGGNLWVGKTHVNWPGSQGLNRISWNGTTPFIVNKVTLKGKQLVISFNQKIGKKSPHIEVTENRYRYHSKYGSEKIDLKSVPFKITQRDRSITLTLPEVKKDYVYMIHFRKFTDKRGHSLMGNRFWYNVAGPK